jgi:hypothetical protein
MRCYYEYHKFVSGGLIKKTYINHETSMLKCIDCEAPKFIRAKGPIDEVAEPPCLRIAFAPWSMIYV